MTGQGGRMFSWELDDLSPLLEIAMSSRRKAIDNARVGGPLLAEKKKALLF